jgi:hypothetical protein
MAEDGKPKNKRPKISNEALQRVRICTSERAMHAPHMQMQTVCVASAAPLSG